MKKIFFAAGFAAVIILGIVFTRNLPRKKANNSGKINIVTTLFPLYDFAGNTGGEKVEVTLLLPPGVEAHSFEPKPSDIANISKADIFIYTGKFMEPWAEDILKGLSGKNIKVVDASAGIKMIPADPHMWLDFDNDKIIIDTIERAVSEKDKNNTAYYRQKADEYKAALSRLDDKYRTVFSRCKSKEIVYAGHYAFGYLANRYNLKYLAAQGVSPDAEPTAGDLVRLVEQIKKNDIRYIFYEELASPKVAETIAGETMAKMLPLSAAHNLSKDDFKNGVSFISVMENNLKSLEIGLQCRE